MIKCSVIIPVFNAFEETEACLRSVLHYTPEADSIIVIDDCSPSGTLKDYLPDSLLADPRLQLSRNDINQGFVKTCNIGMRRAAENDVVLLNSDTEVTPGWLKKMVQAAYSRENIATVTPFTNNGVLCSLPRFCLDNPLPSFCSLNRLSEIVESVSQRSYPELPTCIGFCVYVKRQVLDQIGLFDEEAFGLGYGEENDLSLRAQAAGYVDVLDDATFVWHKGNMSFKDVAIDHQGRLEVIRRRYPHYLDRVSKFCNRDSLREQRLRVLDQLVVEWNSQGKKRVLQVLQNGPFEARGEMLGGTERHVQDLIGNMEQVCHWSLVPSKNCYYLTAHLPGCHREYILALDRTSLKVLFDPAFFDLIHLHHSRFIDHNELCQALVSHGNYLVSMHDFILVCPRFHLYTPFRKVCSGHECAQSCGFSQEYVEQYRRDTRQMLSAARQVICFSDSTRRHVEEIIEAQFAWKELPHSILNVVAAGERRQKAALPYSSDRPFRAAFLGFIPQHKGSLIIEDLIKLDRLPSGVPVQWHVIGKLFLDAGNRVVQHGEYQREELLDKLIAADPDVVLILSICPETYCLTLDEAWNAGIPALVTPFGAPAERVKRTGAGWVLPDLNPETVIGELNRLADSPALLQQAAEAARCTRLLTVQEEAAGYLELYQQFLTQEQSTDLQSLLEYLQQFGLSKAPQRSTSARIIGKMVSITIYLLDSLRVRGRVQKTANALLPKKLIEFLKRSR